MDDQLGVRFIVEHFDQHSTPISTNNQSTPWRPLIVDGHGSHIGIQVVEAAHDRGISLYCAPPHSIHIMQPLDIVGFALLFKYIKQHSRIGYMRIMVNL